MPFAFKNTKCIAYFINIFAFSYLHVMRNKHVKNNKMALEKMTKMETEFVGWCRIENHLTHLKRKKH